MMDQQRDGLESEQNLTHKDELLFHWPRYEDKGPSIYGYVEDYLKDSKDPREENCGFFISLYLTDKDEENEGIYGEHYNNNAEDNDEDDEDNYEDCVEDNREEDNNEFEANDPPYSHGRENFT